MREQRYRDAERAVWASVGAEPSERWLDLTVTGSAVRILELGDGPPVLFLHGASNAATSWASLAARLDGFRCVLIDRPGCGLSPARPGPVDMAALAAFADAFVVDVLDALGLAAANVVGTSFGGYFALRAVAAHPERFVGLVELSWFFGAPVEWAPWIMRVVTRPGLGRLVSRIRPNDAMVRSLLKQVGLRRAVESGAFGEVEIAWFRSLLRDTDTMRNEIDAAPPILTMRGFDESTLLPLAVFDAITVPVLLVWGGDDPMGGPATARAVAGRIAGAELELVPGAGHAPWIDDVEHVAARVRAFLGRG